MGNITQKIRDRIKQINSQVSEMNHIFATEDLVLICKPRVIRGKFNTQTELNEWACYTLSLDTFEIYSPKVFATSKKHECCSARFVTGANLEGIPNDISFPVDAKGRVIGKTIFVQNDNWTTRDEKFTPIEKIQHLNYSDSEDLELTTRRKIKERLKKLNGEELKKAKKELSRQDKKYIQKLDEEEKRRIKDEAVRKQVGEYAEARAEAYKREFLEK